MVAPIDLSPAQKKIVATIKEAEGSHLISGGPGVGKTQVGAALLMAVGSGVFLGRSWRAVDGIEGGLTFFSLAWNALRQHPGVIVDAEAVVPFGYPGPVRLRESYRLLRNTDRVVEELWRQSAKKGPIRKALAAFAASVAAEQALPDEHRPIVEEYCRYKQKRGYLDFSDALLLLRGLLQQDPSAAGRLSWLVVDDVQALSVLAWKIVALLKPKRGLVLLHNPLCRLGMPGTPTEIDSHLVSTFGTEKVTRHQLRSWWRGSKRLAALIEEVAAPLADSGLFSTPGSIPLGIRPRVVTARLPSGGLEFVVRAIVALRKCGVTFSEIAIIFRIGSKSEDPILRQFKQVLCRRDIPALFFNPDRDHELAGDDKLRSRSADSVFVSTPHGLVGQERKHVFVIGVDCHSFPYQPIHLPELSQTQQDDERRAFLAAITRANESLTLVHLYYGGENRMVSPFLRSAIKDGLVEVVRAKPSRTIAPNCKSPIQIKIIGHDMVCPPQPT